MRVSRQVAPPPFLRRVVRLCVPPDDRAALLAELDALFDQRANETGLAAARAWYARQTAGFAIRFGSLRLAGLARSDLLRADARAALRSFRKRPAFAIAFVATMAVATGVLATVYTAARWVLLRPVPGVTNELRLATIRLGSRSAPPFVSFQISHADYTTLRDRLPLQGALAARTPIDVDLRAIDGTPARVHGEMVTANYFQVSGARLEYGRAFLPEEDGQIVGEPVAIVSLDLARRLVGEAALATGTLIIVNGTSVRVVGVAARGFRGVDLPGTAEIWLPASARSIVDPSETRPLSARGNGLWRRMVARLPDGVTVEQVAAASEAAVSVIRAEFRSHSFPATHQVMQVFPGIGLDPSVRREVQRTLTQLAGAALVLLLLAVANLANLTLIEASRRRTALAIRVAMGASQAAVLRAAVTESTLLGIASAVVAIVIATLWSGWYQEAQLSEHGGGLTGMGLDPTIIVLSIGVAWGASLAVSLRPALTSGRLAGDVLMRRGLTDTRLGHGRRALLVTAQVALSVVLLVAAGLLGRTVINLRSIELGFRPEPLLTFALDPHGHGFEPRRLAQLASTLEEDLSREGGVRGAGFIAPSPLRSSYVTAALYGSDDPEARPVIAAGFHVSPGFLPALGIRLIAGADPWLADSGTVVLTRRTLAAVLPGMTPAAAIGRLVPTLPNRGGLLRIGGVIDDIRLSDITGEVTPVILRPLGEGFPGLSLMGIAAVEGGGNPYALSPAVRRVLTRRAPEFPVFDVRSARDRVDLQFAARNAMARAALTLGGLGLLLSAVGLYGVLAAMVAARRREIGVRSALGAAPATIVRRVLMTGLTPVLSGVVMGLAVAIVVGRVLSAQLYGLASTDPISYVGATLVLLGSAVLACAPPAWRATRVSPVEVLREE